MPNWLDDASANRHIKTYVKDFLDLSGNFTVRNNPEEYAWKEYGQLHMGKYSTANSDNGYFGNGLAMDASGTTIVICANQEGNSQESLGGNAYVMKYDESAEIWYQIGQTIIGGNNDCHFPGLSGDGTRLAVGDYGYSSNTGRVLAYDYNSGTNTWDQIGGSTDMVNVVAGTAMDYLKISRDGTTILTGSSGSNPDNARAYRYNSSSNTWTLIGDFQQSTISEVTDANKGFAGFSGDISYDGNRVLLSEHGYDSDADGNAKGDIGRVLVFDYSGSGTTWNLVGDILYPTRYSNSDQFGVSCDMNNDGTVIAVNAQNKESYTRKDDNSYADTGSVSVYQYDATVSGSWRELGQTLYGKDINDEFGYLSLCLSDDGYTLIVGSRANDRAGYDSGYIQKYVYNSSKNRWIQEGEDVYGKYIASNMQRTVCNHDATIFVACEVVASINDYNQGAVQVYKWMPKVKDEFKLDISGGALTVSGGDEKTNALKCSSTQLGRVLKGDRSRDYFGGSVTMSGNGMVMAGGASNSQYAGFAKVYKYNKGSANDGDWNLHQLIYGNDTNTIDYFGSAVKLSRDGNVMAVGANNFSGYASSGTDGLDGFVRVFKEVDNVWTQIGSDIADITQGDGTGGKATISLNSDGTILAVGSLKADSGNGAVRVFEYNSGTDSWSQLGSTLYGDNASSHDFFGTSVDLNDDGTMLAVGAPIDIGGVDYVSGNTEAGYVKVYKYASGSWSVFGKNSEGETQLKAGIRGSLAGVTSGSYSDCFGICVSFNDDGTTLAVGARFLDLAITQVQTGQGCMTVFKYSSEGDVWMNYGQPIFPDPDQSNQAADSVSLSIDGKTMLIGNRLESDGDGVDTRGSSHIYKYIGGQWVLTAGPFFGIQGNGPSVSAVSMSSDGTRFVHGMFTNDDIDSTSGAIQAFQIDYEPTLQIKDGIMNALTGIGADGGNLEITLPYLTGLSPAKRNYEKIWGNNIGSGTYDPDAATPYNHAYLYVKNAVRETNDLLLTGTTDGYALSSKQGAASEIRFSCVYSTRTSLALSIGGGISQSYHFAAYGNVYVSGSRATSDDRLKHNEEPITNALETIRKLTPKHYIKTHKMYDANHNFVLDTSGNPLDASGNLLNEEYFFEDGLIAQEIELIPELKHVVTDECITDDIKEPKTVNYTSIFVRAVKALQELDAIDQEQQSMIESLEARIVALENK